MIVISREISCVFTVVAELCMPHELTQHKITQKGLTMYQNDSISRNKTKKKVSIIPLHTRTHYFDLSVCDQFVLSINYLYVSVY